jgi:hypothetical protein
MLLLEKGVGNLFLTCFKGTQAVLTLPSVRGTFEGG